MARGNRAFIGKILAASGAVMFIASGVVLAELLPVPAETRWLVGTVLAATGVVDTLMALYFIVTDPS